MATKDVRVGGAAALPNNAYRGVYALSNDVDFSVHSLTKSSIDTIQILNIPARTNVLHTLLEMLTAGTTNATIDIGDSGDPNGFVAAAAVTAGVKAGAGAYANLKPYTADAVVEMSNPSGTDLVAGTAKVTAYCVPMD